MIGIEFELKTGYEKIVYELLNGIDYSEYDFYVIENEILENDDNKIIPNKIEGKNFLNVFNKYDYYVIFLNLQIYKKNKSLEKIKTYDDFVKSSCELILLICDNNYIELYFKNEIIKSIILKNLSEKNIDYKIKTKKDDGRYIFELN